MNIIASKIRNLQQYPLLVYSAKWLIIATIVGGLVGIASAGFLISLNWVTEIRESHVWIIAFLPIGGLLIGLLYYYLGNSVVAGNNLLIDEMHNPQKRIPLRMAPLVIIGTLITHLVGGSAGREGTAVQVGGAIADRFTALFKLTNDERKTILILGVSAGFASVFGTPIAGAVFALEVMVVGRMRYEALLPSVLVAVIANYTCNLFPVHHTHYAINIIPQITPSTILWSIFVGILFGITAMIFSKSVTFWKNLFAKILAYAPLRPMVGGIVLALAIWALGTTKYIGLGIPTIVDSFTVELPRYDFILKILLTSFTIGVGFKGGEVTPLFFIGATLGNALVWFVPLPIALLAGMGFVAVFAGATNTPLACIFMGIELFGAESAVFIAIACITAYYFSGHSGIYSSQIVGSPKHINLLYAKGKKLV